MPQIVDGKKLSQEIRAEIRTEVEALAGPKPCLATVLVGDDPASAIYVRNKHRACERTGFESLRIDLPASTPEAELLERVAALNADPDVHGILVQLPLPDHISPATVALAVDPLKDVEWASLMNQFTCSTLT